jgi:7,8-dihydropterin-6-yl-methyl-4-(beta-D-ribofuranosyl)aminobenzene 5'-phosphate synthase
MAEQALVIDTVLGLVVLFGCAHTGLTKSLRTIKDTWPGRIHLVLGGFHLREESETTIRDIICQLKALEVLNVGPAHCTGAAACRLLREAYNEKFLDAAAGQVIAVTS